MVTIIPRMVPYLGILVASSLLILSSASPVDKVRDKEKNKLVRTK